MSVRLLTDLGDFVCKDHRTIRMFSAAGQVRSLRGLHAKIYIIDDDVLLTSANITGTAFSARFEIGQWLESSESEAAISIFSRWWDELSEPTAENWFQQVPRQIPKHDEPIQQGLPKRWQLGDDPGATNKTFTAFADYRPFWSAYKELAKLYESTQRLWDGAPLFLEVDCFLTFLFNSDSGAPSKRYLSQPPQTLTSLERRALLIAKSSEFRDWPKLPKLRVERMNSMLAIQKVLRQNQAGKLNREMIEELVKNTHSLMSNPLAKAKFLNQHNNSLETISQAWFAITEPNDHPEVILQQISQPFGFGRSSSQELLGWAQPDAYPIRNANTNAGMRYFGYAVAKY